MTHLSNAVEVMPYELKLVEGFNLGDVSVADEVFHPDAAIHINGGPKNDLTLGEFKQMVQGLFYAFPDLEFTIEEQFAAGNKVSTRWVATGTNTGPLSEMPPTGKKVKLNGFIIDYLQSGKVSERWELLDQMTMLQQLGM